MFSLIALALLCVYRKAHIVKLPSALTAGGGWTMLGAILTGPTG